jgi:rhomboid family GlyGly-CTERM serine protease
MMKRFVLMLQQRLRTASYWVAIGIIMLCIALHLAGFADQLRFDRHAIETGKPWLLLTGNFVHLGTSHLMMNMLGFVLVVTLVWEHFNWIEWVLVTLFSSLVVCVGLYFFDPDINFYVGFSGTLHGVIVAGCLADLRHYPKSAALLLALVAAKLIWEQLAGPLPGSEDVAGGNVVVNSHLYGAIGGAIIGAVLVVLQKRRLTTKINAAQD